MGQKQQFLFPISKLRQHNMSNPIQRIIAQGEELKKEGDVFYAAEKYGEAVQKYGEAVSMLAVFKGWAFGEMTVISCLTTTAMCYLKQEDAERALTTIDIALRIPSICNDGLVYCRVYYTKSLILEKLGKYLEAILSLDKVIGMGLDMPDNMLEIRERLVSSFSTSSAAEPSATPLPPTPAPLFAETVAAAIQHILRCNCDVQTILPPIVNTANLRGNLDSRDSQGNNIVWAVAQSAMKIAASNSDTATDGSSTSDDPDRVLPVLHFLYTHGVSAEQRFPHMGNRTILQMLVMAGAIKSVQCTIQFGGSIHSVDDNGWSPLIVCCSPDKPFKSSKYKSPENSASTSSSTERDRYDDILEGLLICGSDVNVITKTGLTPLLLCCQSNNRFGIKKCLDAGADITQRCLLGFSAIVWSCIGCNGEGIDSILIDESHETETEDRPADKGRQCIQLLLQYASDIDKKSNNSNSNLSSLVFQMKEDMKCFLMSKLLGNVKIAELTYLSAAASNGDEATTVADNNSNGAISDKLIKLIMTKLLTCTGVMNDQTSAENLYYKLFRHISAITPFVLTKLWNNSDSSIDISELSLDALTKIIMKTDNSSSESTVEEVAARNKLLSAWLHICISSYYGPNVDKYTTSHLSKGHKSADEVPPLLIGYYSLLRNNAHSSIYEERAKNEVKIIDGQANLICGLYRVYKECIEAVLTERYSAAVPTDQLLTLLQQQSAILQLTVGADADDDDDDHDEASSAAVVVPELESCYWRDLLEKKDVTVDVLSVYTVQDIVKFTEQDCLFINLPDLMKNALNKMNKKDVNNNNDDVITRVCEAITEAIKLFLGTSIVIIGEVGSNIGDNNVHSVQSSFISLFGRSNVDIILHSLAEFRFEAASVEDMPNWPFTQNKMNIWRRT